MFCSHFNIALGLRGTAGRKFGKTRNVRQVTFNSSTSTNSVQQQVWFYVHQQQWRHSVSGENRNLIKCKNHSEWVLEFLTKLQTNLQKNTSRFVHTLYHFDIIHKNVVQGFILLYNITTISLIPSIFFMKNTHYT